MQTQHSQSIRSGQYPVTYVFEPGVNEIRSPVHVASHPFLPHSTYSQHNQRPFNSNALQYSNTMRQDRGFRSPQQRIYGQRSQFTKLEESNRVSSTSVPKKVPFEDVKKRYQEKDFGASGVPVFYHSLPNPADFIPLKTMNTQFEGRMPEYRKDEIDKRFPPSRVFIPNQYQNHFIPSQLIKIPHDPNRPHRYHFLPPQIPINQNQNGSPVSKNNQNSQSNIQKEKSIQQSIVNESINVDLEEQTIFCVICSRSYSVSDQESHKQLHRKRFQQTVSLQPVKDISTINQKIDLKHDQNNQRNKLSSKILTNYQNSEEQRRRIQQSRLYQMKSSKISQKQQKQYLKQKDGRIVSYKQNGVGTTGQLAFSLPMKPRESSVFYTQPTQKENSHQIQQRVTYQDPNRGNQKPAETSFVLTPQNVPIRNTVPVGRFETIMEKQEQQQFQSERKIYSQQRNKQASSYSIKVNQFKSREEIISPTKIKEPKSRESIVSSPKADQFKSREEIVSPSKISQLNQSRQSQRKPRFQSTPVIQREQPVVPIMTAVVRETINIDSFDQIQPNRSQTGYKTMQMKRKMKPHSPIQEKSAYNAQPVQSVFINPQPKEEPIVVNYDTVYESITPSAYRSGQMKRKIKQPSPVQPKREPIQTFVEPVSFGENLNQKQQQAWNFVPAAHESQRFPRDTFNHDEQYDSPKKYNQEVIHQRETFKEPNEAYHDPYDSTMYKEKHQEPEQIDFNTIVAEKNPEYQKLKTNQNPKYEEVVPIVNQKNNSYDRKRDSEKKIEQVQNSNKRTPQNSDRDIRDSNQSNNQNQRSLQGQLAIFESRNQPVQPNKNMKKKKIARNAMLAWN